MPRWQSNVQKVIFALLLINTCLLATAVAPPLVGWRSPFAGESAPLLDMALPVEQDSSLLFGNMRFSTEGGMQLKQARLLINGENAGDFGAGELTVRVYEGDVLSIDGSSYQRQLVFQLSAVSTNINSAALPERLVTAGDRVALPPIGFK